MKTEFLRASSESIKLACDLLRHGEVVAVPTETVYGLAGDAKNSEAISKTKRLGEFLWIGLYL